MRNGVKAAETRVAAGQANLRATEASVFSQVVAAYLDVIANSAIVALNQANVKVLDVNLQATNDRFEVGDVTRTDVAQSESRLALAPILGRPAAFWIGTVSSVARWPARAPVSVGLLV